MNTMLIVPGEQGLKNTMVAVFLAILGCFILKRIGPWGTGAERGGGGEYSECATVTQRLHTVTGMDHTMTTLRSHRAPYRHRALGCLSHDDTENTEHTEHTEHTENLEVRCLPPTAYFSNIWAGSEDSEEFFDLLRNDAKTVAGESFLQCAMREGVFNSTGMYVLYVFRSVMCV
jgi:hypothetical protein